MTDLREAAQRALEALELEMDTRRCKVAIAALRAALAQPQIDPVDEYRKGFIAGQIDMRDREETKAEPAQDRHRACPTHCCPVHGCKYGRHDDCPVAAGAVQPVYPRNNGCESCADEAEPLNLSDRAVQRRLAAQWGYVPAAQAEPVEPVAWLAPDGSVRETPAAKSFGEWVWGPDDFKPLYTAPPRCPNCASLEAQQDEPVAWLHPKTVDAHTRPDLGYETCSKDDYGAFPVYTSPFQRLPLTEEEIDKIFKHLCNTVGASCKTMARAVERAHGIKE